MTLKQVMKELKALGNEKTLKHNAKFGAGENQFGVKRGDLRKLAKALKTNHPLALELWATGNVDARFLAVLIMKPKELSPEQLDQMVRSEDFVEVLDWFTQYIIKKHPAKDSLREAWMDSGDPLAARAGWSLAAECVSKRPELVDLKALLDRIEAEMGEAHAAPQWTMNITLVNIGIHHPKLRKRAVSIGEKLGVFSDFPTAKGCTSPFAPIWIDAMVSRQD
jgi:3-methyladenine DNA glycosylase AlkD